MSEDLQPVGLRERKKRQTRADVLAVAGRLFEARGYEQVTVAEIADGANISVKTLFTYFRSKEDLAFANEHRLRDQLVGALRTRAPGESPVDAVAGLLDRLIVADDEDVDGLEGYHRMVAGSDALESRLRRMWQSYEDALAAVLVDEVKGRAGGPRARLAAILLVSMVRSVTSSEVLAEVGRYRSPAGRRKALHDWVATSAEMVRSGLGSSPLV